MAWHKEKKQQTRQRILQAAVKLFLNNGFDEVSINDVMKEAQLTHGGFYNHFASKLALYEQALHFSLFQYQDFFRQKGTKTSLIQFLTKYLNIHHCTGEQMQCPLVYLSTMILHKPIDAEKYRHFYSQVFDVVVDRIASVTLSKPLAVNITSQMVGAVTLARAINQPEKSAMILSTSLQDILLLLRGVEEVSG